MHPSNIHIAGGLFAAMLLVSSGCAGNRTRLEMQKPAVVLESLATSAATDPPPLVRSVAFTKGVMTEEAESRKSVRSEAELGLAIVPVEIPPIYTSDLVSDAVATYSLADIEQMALANNPAIAAANATSAAASGFRQQVGVRPNPTIGYWGSQLADQKTGQNGAFIDQEFVRGNKLALNREVLRHTVEAQRWETETQRYRVLTDVRMRFYEALAAQRQLEATETFAKVAERGVEVAEIRLKAKEGTASRSAHWSNRHVRSDCENRGALVFVFRQYAATSPRRIGVELPARVRIVGGIDGAGG
ncbi:MAG: TolC family protein, partial [Aureliella sp.]